MLTTDFLRGVSAQNSFKEGVLFALGGRNALATTLASFEVNGAATEASPSLIWGTSLSSSRFDSWSVIEETSNCCV